MIFAIIFLNVKEGNIMKFLHAMIRVSDLNKSLEFYKELLGFDIVKELRLDDCTLYYLGCKESGDFQIELTDNDEKVDNYQNGNAFGHFAFAADNLEKVGQKMKKLGIDWLYEPYELDKINSKIAFLKDPDGNEIELIQQM